MTDLALASTGNIQAEDFAISIMNYLKSSWLATIPPVDKIIFDTKFSDLSKDNAVIVKPMVKNQKYGQLGPSRKSFTQHLAIHLWTTGHSAKNNKYSMELEVERIIGANPGSLSATKGIESMEIETFEEIETGSPDSQLNIGWATDETTIARSKATLVLRYDKLVT